MWAPCCGYGAEWWMWGLMLLGTIGFWLLVAYVVRAVVLGGRPAERRSATPPIDEPLRLLDERLARGEIDLEEYQRTRNVLRNAH
ncbi:SHOCT domain-containing protein [Intrasporangium calvum]|uniref:SHOCT domain-containing protein n=1 Tax=Intrasporangium calvum TaxID=53358 RepID=A0ABT5GF30_9MICO|nr:SHOCT domain-containing protein [Intrasporangium calvum]MDC5696853.1 SHOCT domain-containing protein [Intrasporangium calvum]